MQRTGILIGRLHELSARRRKRARHMAGRVFGRIAHVEQIECSRRIGAKASEPGLVDAPNIELARDLVGR